MKTKKSRWGAGGRAPSNRKMSILKELKGTTKELSEPKMHPNENKTAAIY